jgi:hypothetical protein
MLDLVALRVFELGIGNILDLDCSWFGVNNTAIFAYDNLSLAILLVCFPGRGGRFRCWNIAISLTWRDCALVVP